MNDSYFWQMSPLRRLIWLKKFAAGGGGGSSVLKTVSGALLHITDALAKPAKKFVATLEPIQSGSGDPSPENIRPITGHTGANVVRTGKNLLEPKFYDGITYNPSVGQSAFTTLTDVTNTVTKDGNTYSKTGSSWNIIMNMVLPLNESFVGKTLKFSGTINAISGYRCAWYITDAEHITKRKSVSMNELPTWSITIQEGDAYLIWFMNSSSAGTFVLTEPMIELGSTATTYEPYTTQTIPITFPDAAGTVYGGTLTNEDGVWKLRVTEVLFEKNTSTMDNNNEDYPGWRNCGITAIIGSGYNKIFSNQQMNIGTMYGANTNSSNDLIILPKDGNSGYGKTQTEWIALAQDVQIVIPLATPIDYTLSESQALTLLKGENVVWCDDSDSLELQYYAKAEETP